MSDAFTTEIPVRYSDVDTYGHVNNAKYATYMEEARIDYLETVLGDEDLTSAVDSEMGNESTDGEGAEDVASQGDAASATDGSVGIVIANLDIDFLRPVETADSVTVAVEIGTLGDSSFTLEYEISSSEGVHASGETTQVAFDRTTRESRPIPDRWRTAVEEFEGLEAS